ncbi:MAG: nucleotidyltransferase domain-containing protein [bacterium]
MDNEIINKVKELAKQAKSFLDFDKVVVFGSFSKGMENIESDIDVAFFVKEISPNHWLLSAKLFELVDKIDIRIEPIILNEKNDRSGFAKNILETGVIIC